jgi:hypothetical protein
MIDYRERVSCLWWKMSEEPICIRDELIEDIEVEERGECQENNTNIE